MTKKNLSFGWIEACLRYGGVFGAAEKIVYRDIFGLSEPSVSRHQAEFEGLFEAACGKVFVRDKDGRVQGGRLTLHDSAELPEAPVFAAMPSLDRWLQDNLGGSGYFEEDVRRHDPDPLIMRPVIRSVRTRTPLRITYHFPEGKGDRLVSPHAIIRINGLMHIRAYEHLTYEYRDFAITRITRAALAPGSVAYVGNELDDSWSRFRTVVIEDSRSAASENARTGVRLDLGLDEHGRRKVRVREALVPYQVDESGEGYSSPVIIYEIDSTLDPGEPDPKGPSH